MSVPADDEVDEIATHIGASLIELVPGIGPTVARAIDFKIARRKTARDRQFQVEVVAAIKDLWDASERRPAFDELVDSDAFVSAFERSSRAASETISSTKRARLARATASAVFPDTIRAAEIETFLDLTERYSDLHVWLLAFYCDPVAWLEAHGKADAASPQIRGGKRDEPLYAALELDPQNMDIVQAAIEDLQRDTMLGVFTLDEIVGDRRQFAPQTRHRARRFLAFIGETDTTVVETQAL